MLPPVKLSRSDSAYPLLLPVPATRNRLVTRKRYRRHTTVVVAIAITVVAPPPEAAAQVRVDGLQLPAPSGPRTWAEWIQATVPAAARGMRPLATTRAAGEPYRDRYYEFARCRHAFESPDSLAVAPGTWQVHLWQQHFGQIVFADYAHPPTTISDTLRVHVLDALCRNGHTILIGEAYGNAVGLAVPFSMTSENSGFATPSYSEPRYATGGGRISVIPTAGVTAPTAAGSLDTAMVEVVSSPTDYETKIVRVRSARVFNDSVRAVFRNQRESARLAARKRDAERVDRIRARGWSSEVTRLVLSGKIRIGMTREQVRTAWGSPKDINTTLTTSGRLEQWVYGIGSYVYFTDGIVRTIQN